MLVLPNQPLGSAGTRFERVQIDAKACKLLIIKSGGETGILYQG
jgi:hypothetical protein